MSLSEAWEAVSEQRALLATAIDACMLASVTFTANLSWPDDAFDWMDDFTNIRFDFDDDAYLAIFLIAVCFFVVIPPLSFGCATVGLDCIEEWGMDLYAYVAEVVVFGILFIPICQTIFEMFHCVDGPDGDSVVFKMPEMECWGADHTVLVVLAVLALLVLFVGAVIKAGLQDQRSHAVARKTRYKLTCRYVDSKYLVYRLLVVILGTLLSAEEDSVTTLTLVLAVAGVWPFVYFLVFLPHVANKFNVAKCAFYLGVWWSFCASIAAAEENEDATTMLLLSPAFAVVGALAALLRIKMFPPPKEVLTQEQELARRVESTDNVSLTANPINPAGPSAADVEVGDAGGVPVAVEATLANAEGVEDLIAQLGDLGADGRVGKIKVTPKTGPDVPERAIVRLVNAFRDVPQLARVQIVELTGFDMTAAVADAIGAAFKDHPTLVSLDLWKNGLRDEPCLAIAQALATNEALQELGLGRNPVAGKAKQQIKELNRAHPALEIKVF